MNNSQAERVPTVAEIMLMYYELSPELRQEAIRQLKQAGIIKEQ